MKDVKLRRFYYKVWSSNLNSSITSLGGRSIGGIRGLSSSSVIYEEENPLIDLGPSTTPIT
jgi:hypothetical protein